MEACDCIHTNLKFSRHKVKTKICFKGKGTTTKYQWFTFNLFTQKNFSIYVLDDYAVHLMPKVRKALYERGYIPIVMGGSITGSIPSNDNDLHRSLEAL